MFSDKAISKVVADHLAEMRFESLQVSAVHAARRAFLDAYGVMLGATGLSEDVLPYRALAMAASGPAGLIGLTHRTSPALAALANGALAHVLDFGDTFDAGPAHPHAALVPVLLALADQRPETTYADFLTALAVGGDLACRLSIAAPRPFEDGGWYPPPLVNLIAGAAAGAKLLGLDADAILHAMGLALLQGAFPSEIKYDATSPIRGVREAFAARGAVDAALLAAEGAHAFAQPLEGRAGFFAVYGGGPPRDALTERLGQDFYGERVSFKPWPSCRGTHPYIEAALTARHTISAEDVVSIEAEIGPIQEMLIRPQPAKAMPRRAIEAKFSIPFTVAAAMIDGEVSLATFAPQRLDDDGVRALAAKVVERRNPDWGRSEAASGTLTFHLRDGTSKFLSVMTAAGSPQRPMTDAELIEKFVDCARNAVRPWPDDQARRIADTVLKGSAALPVANLFD